MSTYRKHARISGMTLDKAKAITREKLGRLPRVGHECIVLKYEAMVREPYCGFGKATVTVWLVNISGRLTIRESYR